MHPAVDVDPAADQITEDEMTSALRDMSNRKAVGKDELSIDIVKCAGPHAITFLKKIFNATYNEERIPDEWSLAAIGHIYKNKGQRTDCGNQRGITLLSHVSKTYERVLDRKLGESTQDSLLNWQYSYGQEEVPTI